MTDVVELTQEEIQVVHGGLTAEELARRYYERTELMYDIRDMMNGVANSVQLARLRAYDPLRYL